MPSFSILKLDLLKFCSLKKTVIAPLTETGQCRGKWPGFGQWGNYGLFFKNSNCKKEKSINPCQENVNL